MVVLYAFVIYSTPQRDICVKECVSLCALGSEKVGEGEALMTCLMITMRLRIRGFIKLEDVLLIERTET